MLSGLLAGSVVDAARGLVGAHLISAVGGCRVEVKVTETEAYGGSDDPASHAYQGATPRNRSMFAIPGTAYVYRAYGVHWCLNVATGAIGEPAAVLLRGAEPITGLDEIRRRRGRSDHLLDGPGKLAQGLGVTGEHDGVDLLAGGVLALHAASEEARHIVATSRVGVSTARARRWRFLSG